MPCSRCAMLQMHRVTDVLYYRQLYCVIDVPCYRCVVLQMYCVTAVPCYRCDMLKMYWVTVELGHDEDVPCYSWIGPCCRCAMLQMCHYSCAMLQFSCTMLQMCRVTDVPCFRLHFLADVLCYSCAMLQMCHVTVMLCYSCAVLQLCHVADVPCLPYYLISMYMKPLFLECM